MSGCEGRDPYDDYVKILNELTSYSDALTRKKTIVAANKMDIPGAEENLQEFRKKLPETEVLSMSAATTQGVRELLLRTADALRSLPPSELMVEENITLESLVDDEYTLEFEDGMWTLSGTLTDRLLSEVNLYDNRSMSRFQRLLRVYGIIDELRSRGVRDGDTIRFGDTEFDFVE